MLKRMISISLCLFLIFGTYIFPVGAISIQTEMISQCETLLDRIDALYELRAQLALNPEIDGNEILQIDQQLDSLGMNIMTQSEVTAKLGGQVETMANVVSTDSTTWSSIRTIMPCQGKFYEIQVITGVPEGYSEDMDTENSRINTDSYLYGYEPIVIDRVDDVEIGAKIFTVALSGATSNALDHSCPYLSAALSTGATILDLVEAGTSGLSSTEVLDNVEGICQVTMYTTMRYILVKTEGASDDDQIIGYVGNMTYSHIEIDLAGGKVITKDGDVYATTDDFVIYEKLQSQYWGNSYMVAAENCWKYQSGVHPNQIENAFYLLFMDFNCIVEINDDGEPIANETVRISLPFEGTSFYG